MAYNNYARAYMAEALESMPDYATALRTYESRKPYIKGKHKGERPLGRNRKQDRSRIRIDEKGNIVVQHWQTDIITYLPDGGLILRTDHYTSISTAQIMQELLGVERICRVHCKIYYRHNNSFHHVQPMLVVNADGGVTFSNDEYVWVAMKQRMAEYREKYGFFLEYAKQVLTLSSDFTVGAGVSNVYPNFEGETLKEWYMAPIIDADARHQPRAMVRAREALFDYLDFLSTKEENERLQPMYELLSPLTYMMGSDWFRSNTHVTWSCDYKQFKRKFENMIKYQFGSYIFARKLASKKSPVRDPNAKYLGM